jgi:hypothetical protein
VRASLDRPLRNRSDVRDFAARVHLAELDHQGLLSRSQFRLLERFSHDRARTE